MATFQDFFSAEQIKAIKSTATAQTIAQQCTDYVCTKAWEMLYDIAANIGQTLDRHFWRSLDAKIKSNGECIVCLKGKHKREVLNIRYDKLFAHHLSALLKQDYQLVWVKRSFAIVITWKNWSTVYNKLSRPIDTNVYDNYMTKREIQSVLTARKKESDFYDLARPIRSKKGGRMRISFEEARAQRLKAERLSAESRIIYEATKIFAIV